jgi:hypothetical protein
MYYKGNNIGLNYDAANGTWSFSNEPQDYIDKNAFSTPDPIFNYTPPSDEADEEDTNCPEGYIYDNTLKQCVPDPAKQNQYSQQQNQGGNNSTSPVRIAGTNRTTTDGNFVATDDEYDKMTASELVENYKQRRFIKKNDKGELVIDFNRVKRKGGVLDALFGRAGQPQDVEEMASLNKVIDYLVDKNILTQNQIYGTTAAGQTQFNNEVVIPTIAKFEADYYGIPTSEVLAPGFGDSIYGTKASVQQFDDYMAKKLAAFSTVANNSITNYKRGDLEYQIKEQEDSAIEKEKARKAKFEADQAEIKANEERIKAENRIRDEEEAQAKKEKQQESDDFTNLKTGESTTDSSGDTYTRKNDGGYTFTPSKTNTNTKTYENKRRGGYTGSTAGRGGTSSTKAPSSAGQSFKQYGRF